MKRYIRSTDGSADPWVREPHMKNLVDDVRWNMRAGMSADESVDAVATKFGFHEEGKIYEYLLKRAYEIESGEI